MLGESLRDQGITELIAPEKSRWYVKVPAFSFAKLQGMDIRLSPEMKSTGEAIGYDDQLMRAMYKALQASGTRMQNYGTVFAWIGESEKEETLPLIRRFYQLGFNIEAERETAELLKENGIRTHAVDMEHNGLEDICERIRQGYVTYVVNTGDVRNMTAQDDPENQIRFCAISNGVPVMTATDTAKVLLDALEDITFKVSTIDAC